MEKQVNKLRIQKDVRTALRTAGSAIGNKLGVRPAGKLPNRVKLLVSIVNRNDEVRLKETIDEVSVSLTVKFEGVGTAHSQVLDYLGIGETEKTVAFSLIPESDEEKNHAGDPHEDVALSRRARNFVHRAADGDFGDRGKRHYKRGCG